MLPKAAIVNDPVFRIPYRGNSQSTTALFLSRNYSFEHTEMFTDEALKKVTWLLLTAIT